MLLELLLEDELDELLESDDSEELDWELVELEELELDEDSSSSAVCQPELPITYKRPIEVS